MLGGIVIGMNVISFGQSVSKGEYLWAAVSAAIILIVYVVEKRKK